MQSRMKMFAIALTGLVLLASSANAIPNRMKIDQSFSKYPSVGTDMANETIVRLQIDFKISGTIPNIKQPTSMTCWAASAAMMQSWKDNSTYKIEDVTSKAGADYKTKFQANQGLLGSEKPLFLKALGLKTEPPQNYTVQGWLKLLQSYGPLWVTTNEGTDQHFAIHARILKGIAGDGTPDATFLTLIDPATGTEMGESVSVFTKKLEDIAKADLGAGAEIRPQVVHY